MVTSALPSPELHALIHFTSMPLMPTSLDAGGRVAVLALLRSQPLLAASDSNTGSAPAERTGVALYNATRSLVPMTCTLAIGRLGLHEEKSLGVISAATRSSPAMRSACAQAYS